MLAGCRDLNVGDFHVHLHVLGSVIHRPAASSPLGRWCSAKAQFKDPLFEIPHADSVLLVLGSADDWLSLSLDAQKKRP